MPKTLDKVIVSVGFSPRFEANLTRLQGLLKTECSMTWRNLPPGSPSHTDVPYGFKIWAIEEAVRVGFRYVWWMDSSIVPVAPMKPVWSLIKEQGYWFSRNYDYTNGAFTCDAALPILNVTREESFGIPQVVATTFGLDMGRHTGREFMDQWKGLALAGAFKGPWGNQCGEASSDPRVKGHRHDQTAAAVIAHRLDMKLTDPPKYFAEQGFPQGKDTVVTVVR